MIGKLFSAAVLALAAAFQVQAQPASDGNFDWNNGKVRIVAHRGYWNCEGAGYARNSVAALKCAQENGFWGSEFDVNITSDDVLLVYHDGTIDGKRIEDFPYSEFRKIRLDNGERIPTIDDYLKQARNHPETVLVYELKSQSSSAVEDRLVDKSVEKLKEYGLYDPSRVMFISFSRHICDRIAEEMPEFVNQYLGSDCSPDSLNASGVNGIDFHYSVFGKNPDWLGMARKHGMSVNCWTVDNVSDIEAMISLGVDCITTDFPDRVRDLLDKEERAAR